ncbi:putative peptidase S10 family protein [Lyophyllum shimeji]|uniref:Carboxypeptidase n=1 Tax=Lyophyllum shimeji TaxID=47721 RepID=A0A9P3PGI1_LYOSH|nr:putative peptidase S10 family protein [Lyophyllum shimeji]
MKAFGLLLISCLSYTIRSAAANPILGHDQVVLGGSEAFQRPFRLPSFEAELSATSEFLSDAKKAILKGKHNLEKWIHDGKEFIKQNGLLYEIVSMKPFGEYQLRITEPDLCDPSVKQYSGYLDVAEDKHLFFWFFESRSSPAEDPLVLWLNGGPGCSSSTGLLFELGPCSIANQGKNTTHNPNSWNNNANIIFLDQPVNVGYSYADDGTTVSTSPVAGKDVYAFLQLFLDRFPKYSKQPFHIAAESYGGTYAPNFANIIYQENKKLGLAPVPHLKHINLASIVLANGLTDPYIQFASIPDYVCEGPYPVYKDPQGPECQSLRAKVPTCQRLIQSCYRFNSRFTCFPAMVYCSTIFGSLQQTGLNPYDVRRKCDRAKDGDLCYKQLLWVETWLNDPKTKAALGVNPDQTFASCNFEVNRAFASQGDGMHNSAILLPELVNDGVRLLVYAGNADMMCNYMGNERWVEQLDTKFHEEFSATESTPWIHADSGRVAGEVRSAGGGGFTAGNVTFVNVYEAGHMVPYDQPEAAVDLFTKWITDTPLTLRKAT